MVQSASIIAQHFVQAYKSDKQVQNNSGNYRMKHETPFTTGLALSVHHAARSKSLICKLQALQCAITYTKVLEIENTMSNHVKENIVKNGYYLPDSMSQNTFVWFALDNIDFLEDTASGKDTLHGTGIAMYHSEAANNPKEPLQLKRPADKKDTKNRDGVDIQYCAGKG